MKIIKRSLYLFISATVILAGVVRVNAEEPITDLTATPVNESYLDYLKSVNEPAAREGALSYEEDEIVTIIVELNDKPVLDYFTNGSVDNYLKSSRASIIESKLTIAQDNAVASIENVIGDIDVENRYSTIMNGFSIKTEYANLQAIRDQVNVKRAFVAINYEAVEPTMDSSNETVGAVDVWNEQYYQGEKVVVGVLDTGLDTTHEAFQQDLTDIAVDKDAVANALVPGTLTAQKILKASVLMMCMWGQKCLTHMIMLIKIRMLALLMPKLVIIQRMVLTLRVQ